MYQTSFHSPLGPLKLIANERALTHLEFNSQLGYEKLNPVLEIAVKQLEEYFSGQRNTFSVPLEPNGSDFQLEVWKALEQIPFGQSMSYSSLAEKCGGPEKIRAVANANGQNKIPIIIPCHRVIGKSGELTGYLGGIEKKKWLLDHEGVLINNQHELF